MSQIVQLILDVGGYALALPESIKSGYDIQNEPLYENVDMISGRRTREYRGMVWVISHQNGYLREEEKNRFINACEKGISQSILCSFLPQDSTELQSSLFLVTDYRRPKFMWSRNVNGSPVPVWADYYVALREVRPHA